MVADWLQPDDWAWFTRTHFHRAPLARPHVARGAVALFGWPTLERVLASEERPLDLLTVSRGRLEEVAPPTTVEQARGLMREGISVVIRGAERHDAGLAALAASFEQVLPGEVHVQLYVTPGGTNSYGWHYDFEDVFIVQTAGVKDYYFRANTAATDAVLGDPLDFSAVKREVTPLMSARLLAGDWLYLPATWWHLVTCAEDSLSISVGVMPPEAARAAKRLPAGWSGRRA